MNSEKSFRYSLIVLALFIMMILMHILQEFMKQDFSNFYGFISIVIMALISFGSYHAVTGLKDRNSAKKIIGIILNTGYLILFISLIIANVLDLYKAIE